MSSSRDPATICFVNHQGLTEAFEKELQNILISPEISPLSKLNRAAIDVRIQRGFTTEELQKMSLLAHKFQTDFAYFSSPNQRLPKKLIIFDMDSTLINAEVIDEMAKVHGIGEKISRITERAMNGELNFDEALKERVLLLRGFDAQKMEQIYQNIKINPGVEKLIQIAHKQGMKTGIASGGFRYFAERFQARLHMNFSFANELELQNEKLTGNILGEIVNAQKKAAILKLMASQENITLQETIAVGDGANDLFMLKVSGMGVAYHAKGKVRNETSFHINYNPMSALLYYLGIEGDHFYETL